MRKIHSIVQKMTIILILLIPYLNLVAMTLEEFRALPDDRIAIRTSQGVRSARPLSSEQVELVLGMTATSVAEQPAAYRVISFEDENYAYEKFVSPTKAKVKKEMELKGVKGSPFNKFERSIVKLELPFPMQKGKEYFFLAQGVGSGMVVSTHSAEGFVFNGMENLQSADNSINLAVLGLQRVMPVGPSLVVLHFGADFSTTQASRLENYAVTVNGKQVGVTNLGRRTMVDTYVPTGWPYKAIPEHKIFLQLETPFKTGDLVAVSVTEKVTTAMRTASFSFDTKKTLSNSIKINQIGYLTDSPVKMAYLGQWMGSFPENPDIPGQAKTPDSKNTKMSIDQKFNEALKKAENHTEMVYNKDGSEADNIDENKPNPSLLFKVEPDFYICDAVSGKTMFTGKAKLVHVSGVMDECFYGVDHSGENVYELDFTPVKKPGRYFVSIPQTGRSFDFDIKNDVYSKAFKLMGHGLFTQRCGIELKPPYTEWRRVACHNNGVAPTTVSRLSGEHNAFKTLSDSVDYDRLKHAALNPAILQLNADKNLLAYWPLDGNFNDASGNGYDLEPFGSNPSFEREKQLMPGKNMVYGPTVADAPNGAGTEKMRIDIANGYTMSMWIRFAGGSKFAGTLMGHAAEEWNDPRIKIGAGWGVIRGGVGIRGGELNVGRLSDGKWHHIALVVPPKDETPYLARMYVDGEIRKKADIKPEVDGKVFCLGALTGDASDGKYFDDARVYKRALKDREIKTLSRKWGDLAVALNTYGGHHDAGDYNPRSHIDVAWT
ncbi:hypothetical protein H8D64_02515, partial [PVC group bacterium]|nr:hypothetical protein [PVC group bacterium]